MNIDLETYPLTYKDASGRDIMFANEIVLPGGPHECVLSTVEWPPENSGPFDFAYLNRHENALGIPLLQQTLPMHPLEALDKLAHGNTSNGLADSHQELARRVRAGRLPVTGCVEPPAGPDVCDDILDLIGSVQPRSEGFGGRAADGDETCD